jgi:hypothetical protein
MTNENIKNCAIIVMVIALAVNTLSYCILSHRYVSLQLEVVKRGYLEWIPNEAGSPFLKWKEVDKTK